VHGQHRTTRQPDDTFGHAAHHYSRAITRWTSLEPAAAATRPRSFVSIVEDIRTVSCTFQVLDLKNGDEFFEYRWIVHPVAIGEWRGSVPARHFAILYPNQLNPVSHAHVSGHHVPFSLQRRIL
jgi:hypothetical protein